MLKSMLLFHVTLLLFFGEKTLAQTLICRPDKSVSFENIETKESLRARDLHIRIGRVGENYLLQRCSFTQSQGHTTCDSYAVDHTSYTQSPAKFICEIDDSIPACNGFPIKHYYFAGQLDVQLYQDGSYIENMGRGIVYFGQCAIE